MGFKNFVRADKSGIINDFLYPEAKSTGNKNVQPCSCGNLPEHGNYKVFFNNWFSTPGLFLEMQKRGYRVTATFRNNRMGGCPVMAKKRLKKVDRSSFDYRTDANSGLHLIRWFDNNCVQIVSTYSGVQAFNTIKRWDGKAKANVDVPCPDMVSLYNE